MLVVGRRRALLRRDDSDTGVCRCGWQQTTAEKGERPWLPYIHPTLTRASIPASPLFLAILFNLHFRCSKSFIHTIPNTHSLLSPENLSQVESLVTDSSIWQASEPCTLTTTTLRTLMATHHHPHGQTSTMTTINGHMNSTLLLRTAIQTFQILSKPII